MTYVYGIGAILPAVCLQTHDQAYMCDKCNAACAKVHNPKFICDKCNAAVSCITVKGFQCAWMRKRGLPPGWSDGPTLGTHYCKACGGAR